LNKNPKIWVFGFSIYEALLTHTPDQERDVDRVHQGEDQCAFVKHFGCDLNIDRHGFLQYHRTLLRGGKQSTVGDPPVGILYPFFI
jgi:hypothetical protein